MVCNLRDDDRYFERKSNHWKSKKHQFAAKGRVDGRLMNNYEDEKRDCDLVVQDGSDDDEDNEVKIEADEETKEPEKVTVTEKEEVGEEISSKKMKKVRVDIENILNVRTFLYPLLLLFLIVFFIIFRM